MNEINDEAQFRF